MSGNHYSAMDWGTISPELGELQKERVKAAEAMAAQRLAEATLRAERARVEACAVARRGISGKFREWNIGGARLPEDGADPTLVASYTIDGLSYVISTLRQLDADIITLQETHTSPGYCQAQLIADALGYQGWVNDELAESHVDPTQRLGQAIITRWPIKSHDFTLFYNPHFKVDLEDGRIETSHDKGRTHVEITLPDGHVIAVQTLHVTPFRRSGTPIDSPEAKRVLADVADKLQADGPGIIQGDFNMDVELLQPHLPELFAAGFVEIPQLEPNEVGGRRYDHVMYRCVAVLDNKVMQGIATDHYPIITRFKLPET